MLTVMLFHMYQVFSSLLGHLHFSLHFFSIFMEQLFLNHPICVKSQWLSSAEAFWKHNESASQPEKRGNIAYLWLSFVIKKSLVGLAVQTDVIKAFQVHFPVAVQIICFFTLEGQILHIITDVVREIQNMWCFGLGSSLLWCLLRFCFFQLLQCFRIRSFHVCEKIGNTLNF